VCPQFKNIIKPIGGLNVDDNPTVLPEGDYVGAKNIRIVFASERHDSGLVQTLQGDVEVPIRAIANLYYYGEPIGINFVYEGFEEVQIGNQVWMKKNWSADYPGSKVYDNNQANVDIYGRLYTWRQINEPDFLPEGWRVPTEADLDELLTYLGGELIAGGKLKEVGESHWYSPNTDANDINGFSALPAGKYDLLFNLLGRAAFFWLKDEAPPPGEEGEEQDTQGSGCELLDLLLTEYVQNVEHDNMNPASETRWTIVTHDATNKFIVVDHDLPAELSDYGTDFQKRWIAQNVPGNLVYISNIEWANRKFYYSYKKGTLSVGQSICFMNAMRSFYLNPLPAIIPVPMYATWNQTGEVWRHSDGTYRLVSTDWDVDIHVGTHTLWSSSDLLNWTMVGETYKYKAGEAPFNKSWCVGTVNLANLTAWAGRYQIPGTTNFAKIVSGNKANGDRVSAIVIFDENYDVVYIPENEFIVPGYPPGQNLMIVGGNIIAYNGKLLMSIEYYDWTTSGNYHYKTLIAEIDSLYNPTLSNIEVAIEDKIPNSFMSGDYSNPLLFSWNGDLYLFVVGEPQNGEPSTANTPLAGRYKIGLFHRQNGVWTPYKQNPVIIDPTAAADVYGYDLLWATAGMGGGLAFIQVDRKVYFFGCAKAGTNTYRVGRWILDLPEGINWFGYRYKKEESSSVVYDYDDNAYHVVQIGNQLWMVENLKTTHYRDGTPIPNIINNNDWAADTIGAYCWYNNDITNKQDYGALYNWYAVNNVHGLAPEGWRVPTYNDFYTLNQFLTEHGGNNGGQLKETGYTHWNEPNTGATNTFGFTALGTGYRDNNGGFYHQKNNGYLFHSTEKDDDEVFYALLYAGSSIFNWNTYILKGNGLTVRCVRDV